MLLVERNWLTKVKNITGLTGLWVQFPVSSWLLGRLCDSVWTAGLWCVELCFSVHPSVLRTSLWSRRGSICIKGISDILPFSPVVPVLVSVTIILPGIRATSCLMLDSASLTFYICSPGYVLFCWFVYPFSLYLLLPLFFTLTAQLQFRLVSFS